MSSRDAQVQWAHGNNSPCYESQAVLFPPSYTARGRGGFGGKRESERCRVELYSVTSKVKVAWFVHKGVGVDDPCSLKYDAATAALDGIPRV